jgi:hypothetical protein
MNPLQGLYVEACAPAAFPAQMQLRSQVGLKQPELVR